jgi:hypothetical protein
MLGKGRPAQPPRLPAEQRPTIPANGEIPSVPMPNEISYDVHARRLNVGGGYIENVGPAVWNYQIDESNCLCNGSAIEKLIASALSLETVDNRLL